MPASLSKLKKQDNYPSISFENYSWYIRSRDNPRDIVDTPYQQELKQWKKVINGVQKTKKEIREACQQFSLNCTTEKT